MTTAERFPKPKESAPSSPGSPVGHRQPAAHGSSADGGAGFLELRVWAEMHEDAQRARIAASNRAERGGVDPFIYREQLDALAHAEHGVALAMRRCYRRVAPPSVRSWQVETPGVGEHLLARLLGTIGHPRIAQPHHWQDNVLVPDAPYERSVSQLWSYCGRGDPARRKHKGMTQAEAFALGNPRAQMIVHLLAEACMKQIGSPAKEGPDSKVLPPGAKLNGDESNGFAKPSALPARRRSPYRDVYEDARERYADRVHAVECKRCGPSGKPALVGSPWSAAHQHAAALRLVGKELLRDLWVAAGA